MFTPITLTVSSSLKSQVLVHTFTHLLWDIVQIHDQHRRLANLPSQTLGYNAALERMDCSALLH